MYIYINLQNPYILGDPDNFKMANPKITPSHIKPEWYIYIFFYVYRQYETLYLRQQKFVGWEINFEINLSASQIDQTSHRVSFQPRDSHRPFNFTWFSAGREFQPGLDPASLVGNPGNRGSAESFA